jgi:superfamily II DNA or RNA helicase
VVDVVMLQTLARKDNLEELVGGYGLVVVDECHHIPAAAFEHAVKQIPARRWLGLTATPYRRDKLDDLIAMQLGAVRHTITHTTQFTSADNSHQLALESAGQRPTPVLHVHDTAYRYVGDADPAKPGGMAAIYRDLVNDDVRIIQVVDDVTAALNRGRHCLVLTQWTTHVERFTDQFRQRGLDPVVLRGGMNTTARHEALTRLNTDTSPRLVVATGPFVGEGFDCPVLDTLFLASPIAFKGRLVQYAGRIMRPHPGKTTAEVHDYHDIDTGVLASSLAKRAPGYISLGFPDPRKARR